MDTTLTPYQTLVETHLLLAQKVGGRLATVNYEHFTRASPGKYLKVQLCEFAGQEMFIGVNPVNWQTREQTSRLFAAPYSWKYFMEGRPKENVPRLRPHDGLEIHFRNNFAFANTLLELAPNGFMFPTLTGRYAPFVRPRLAQTRVVQRFAVPVQVTADDENKRYMYDPRLLEPLANTLLDSLNAYVHAQDEARRKNNPVTPNPSHDN